MSDSLRPHGLYSPWNSPGQNTGVRPFPSPGDLPNPGIKPRSPALQADSLPAEPQGKPNHLNIKPVQIHQFSYKLHISVPSALRPLTLVSMRIPSKVLVLKRVQETFPFYPPFYPLLYKRLCGVESRDPGSSIFNLINWSK